jgi:hypothetical protein
MDRLVIEGMSVYAMLALALAPLALALLTMALAFRGRGPARTHKVRPLTTLQQRVRKFKWSNYPAPTPTPKQS